MKIVKYAVVLSVLQYLLIAESLGQAINIRIDAVEKSVVFLYGATADGDFDSSQPLGTGFFVEVPLLSNPKRAYRFLVTARHIVDPQWAHCPNSNPSVIYARLNRKQYDPTKNESGTGQVPLALVEQGKPNWLKHPDDEVDAAVLLLNAPQFENYDIASVPLALFPTPEEQERTGIAASVVSAGLIPTFTGKNRNYPFFKFGQISSKPAESVEAARCTTETPVIPEKVWFIAANLVPGNSGSPIFFVPPGGYGLSFGGGRVLLLGVQSLSIIPFDIAGMTPSQFVYEIIEAAKPPDADLHRGNITPATSAPTK